MAITRYDAEDLLDTVLGIMKNGDALNVKLAAIEAEKAAKGMALASPLKTFTDASYFLQTWTEKILNTSPAIFYGIEDVQAEANGPVVAKTFKVFVEVVFVDSLMRKGDDAARRINRYARALEEIFAENFAPAVAGGKVKVDSVRPMAFKLSLDSDDEVRVGGISLTISIA